MIPFRKVFLDIRTWRILIYRFLFVGEKQVSSASPAFDLRGNKGEAGKAFASPLHG
jgi:hypothetical protein